MAPGRVAFVDKIHWTCFRQYLGSAVQGFNHTAGLKYFNQTRKFPSTIKQKRLTFHPTHKSAQHEKYSSFVANSVWLLIESYFLRRYFFGAYCSESKASIIFLYI